VFVCSVVVFISYFSVYSPLVFIFVLFCIFMCVVVGSRVLVGVLLWFDFFCVCVVALCCSLYFVVVLVVVVCLFVCVFLCSCCGDLVYIYVSFFFIIIIIYQLLLLKFSAFY